MITNEYLEGKDVKIFASSCEDSAMEQITTMCNLPAFKDSKIRIMPDVHAGSGCVIGFTADLKGKIPPNIIGVDICCGVSLFNLHVCLYKKDQFLDKIQNKLENWMRQNIPTGFSTHTDLLKSIEDEKIVLDSETDLHVTANVPRFEDLAIKVGCDPERAINSLGTLGGGNHFIEISRDDKTDLYYLVIHSGSRNIGLATAKYYQAIAEKYVIDKYNETKDEIYNVPKEMAFLEKEEHVNSYLNDMEILDIYSHLNKRIMARLIAQFLEVSVTEICNTTHNYIKSDRIVRKGAISADDKEIAIIPINMRDGSLIVRGKGNNDWNNSAPHGAGRLMSRGDAYRGLSLDEFQKSMEGIVSGSVNENTLDESPFAYKAMDEILSNISDTVEVITHIKPVYNFKDISGNKRKKKKVADDVEKHNGCNHVESDL